MAAVTPHKGDLRTSQNRSVNNAVGQVPNKRFAARNAAVGQPPRPIPTPTSDPFTDALREAQDGDGDERIAAGRLVRDGVKPSEEGGGPDLHPVSEQPQESGANDSGGNGDGDNGSAQGKQKVAQAQAMAEQTASSEHAQPTLSAREQHSNSVIATVSLDSHASASFLMEPSYQKMSSTLKLPSFQRQPNAGDVLNELQAKALQANL